VAVTISLYGDKKISSPSPESNHDFLVTFPPYHPCLYFANFLATLNAYYVWQRKLWGTLFILSSVGTNCCVIWEFAYPVPCSESYGLYMWNVILWHVRIFLLINNQGLKYGKCCHGNVSHFFPVLVHCICYCRQYKVLKVLYMLFYLLASLKLTISYLMFSSLLLMVLFGLPIFENIFFCFISLFFINTHLVLHVKSPVFVYNFNKAWI